MEIIALLNFANTFAVGVIGVGTGLYFGQYKSLANGFLFTGTVLVAAIQLYIYLS